jgi:hypothetical protein
VVSAVHAGAGATCRVGSSRTWRLRAAFSCLTSARRCWASLYSLCALTAMAMITPMTKAMTAHCNSRKTDSMTIKAISAPSAIMATLAHRISRPLSAA